MGEMTLAEVPEALGPVFEKGDPLAAGRTQERRYVAIMGQIVGAIAEGNYDELRNHLSPDVTLEIAAPPTIPWVRQATGVDEVVAAVAHNFRTVREQRPTPLALAAQGDTVIVMARERGIWAASGEPYEVLLSQQWTFRGQQLACFRSVAAFTAPDSSAAQASASV